MPTGKSKAASAAPRTRAPQPTAKAAGKSTQTRESRDSSDQIVPQPATPFQGLAGLNQHPGVPLQSSQKDEPLLHRGELKRWGGNPHNTALAEAAEAETRCDDLMPAHLTALTTSPMFGPLVERCRGEGDPDWNLAMFGARLFHAGVCAGRRELGRGTIDGDLLMDAPWRPEAVATITAARAPSPREANPLLNLPGSKLFRPGRDYWEHECLPFVAEQGEEHGTRNNWHFERPESLAVQTELGKQFAAAYFLFLSRNGSTSFPLPWIIESMQHNQNDTGGDSVAQGFFFHLLRLLSDFGRYVTAEDVDEHLRAVIGDDRSYYEPDDLLEVGA